MIEAWKNIFKNDEDVSVFFKAIGKSYVSIQILNERDNIVSTVFANPEQRKYFPKQIMDFKSWKEIMLDDYIHPDDASNALYYISRADSVSDFPDIKENVTVQYRRNTGEEYRWTELCIFRLESIEKDGAIRIICTQRDIHGELAVNRHNLEKEIIFKSVINTYRSVYLVDFETSEYTTIKPDELLFGIPEAGKCEELLNIISEFMDDDNQKIDLKERFSVDGLIDAFNNGFDIVAKEYNSSLIGTDAWMSITAIKSQASQNLKNKCILTFVDLTEPRRIEKVRNETKIALDVLSSKFIAVFFINGIDFSFHPIRVPKDYQYLDKQFSNIIEAFEHYVCCYVLEEYRDKLRKIVNSLARGTLEFKDNYKQEYVYRSVNDKWIRFSITAVPGVVTSAEYILAFEDYNDTYEQLSHSAIYNKIMLADYEHMYEYDPDKDYVYELKFDGERLVREETENSRDMLRLISDPDYNGKIHPEDMTAMSYACSKDIIMENIMKGKTVNHMYIRRIRDGMYHSYMYGFHYYKEFGKSYVLIMERDSDKEIV